VFKVCGQCAGEYQSWVSVCPDCNVPLDLQPGEQLASSPDAELPVADLVLLRVDGPWALQELAEVLRDAGFSSRIDTHPLGQSIGAASYTTQEGNRGYGIQLGIYVPRADAAAAQQIVRDAIERSIPDLESVEVAEHDPSACPACGEPTPEEATACASCGLEFPELGSD
jgi:hypothetical protein